MDALSKVSHLLVNQPVLRCRQLLQWTTTTDGKHFECKPQTIVVERTWNGFASEKLALNTNFKKRTATWDRSERGERLRVGGSGVVGMFKNKPDCSRAHLPKCPRR